MEEGDAKHHQTEEEDDFSPEERLLKAEGIGVLITEEEATEGVPEARRKEKVSWSQMQRSKERFDELQTPFRWSPLMLFDGVHEIEGLGIVLGEDAIVDANVKADRPPQQKVIVAQFGGKDVVEFVHTLDQKRSKQTQRPCQILLVDRLSQRLFVPMHRRSADQIGSHRAVQLLFSISPSKKRRLID